MYFEEAKRSGRAEVVNDDDMAAGTEFHHPSELQRGSPMLGRGRAVKT